VNRIAFTEEDTCFNDAVRLYGVGRMETMPAGFVTRRQGLPAFLLVLFHDEVFAEVNGNLLKLAPGTLVFWNRHRPHYFGHPSKPWNHSWVVFSGTALNDDEGLWQPLFESPQRVRDETIFLDGFSRLLREFEEMERPSLPIITSHVRLLLQEMGRERIQGSDAALAKDPIRRACRWIDANLKNKITVEQVAVHAGFSPSRLQQLFHLRLGCSVQVWVERQRLQEARYWLMHSGLNISEIAERTGFSDGFYLTRRFTKAFGLNPSAYRKLQEQGAPLV
jgi:AraC-like DNA-binding protein